MFDSGLGGLTVLSALMAALPHEKFVYLGDTARLPYGSKPLSMVRGFAEEITEELLDRGVKAITIACNTASAASLPDLATRCEVPVWGVVEPGVSAALAAVKPGHAGRASTIGILGTSATIEARVYQDELEAAGVSTWARSCPMFVPLVEEGLQDNEIGSLVVDHYLSDRPELDAVILACTHYPLLTPALRAALGNDVTLIDSSQAVAAHVAVELAQMGLLAGPHASDPGPEVAPRVRYLVTGDVEVFGHTAGRLGGPPAPAEHVVLGVLDSEADRRRSARELTSSPPTVGAA